MANILAIGSTAATSTDVVCAAGVMANLSLVAAVGASLPASAEAIVYAATSGANVEVCRLNNLTPVRNVVGPGTFRVTRVSNGVSFGIDSLA